MYCPKCKAENFSKNGTVNGQNQYSCAVCGYNVTVPKFPSEVTEKRHAVILYFAGCSFEEIKEHTGLEEQEVKELINMLPLFKG